MLVAAPMMPSPVKILAVAMIPVLPCRAHYERCRPLRRRIGERPAGVGEGQGGATNGAFKSRSTQSRASIGRNAAFGLAKAASLSARCLRRDFLEPVQDQQAYF